jgi:hypothetical protein
VDGLVPSAWRSLLVLGALGLSSACGASDLCGNKLVARVRSPGGTHDAVVFERDCGVTSGFSIQVSVLPAGSFFREQPSFWVSTEGGDALVVDDNRGGVPIGPGGGPAVKVAWTDDAHVTLTYDPSARVFKAETRVAGVGIQHVRSGEVQ